MILEGEKLKKTLFIKNAAIFTVTSVILRVIGIIFKIWLAKLIGSEGIGLHQLIFSVYMLVTTFASSGISTAVTRLIAEEMAVGTKKGCLKILRRSVELSMIIALLSAVLVFFGAKFIAIELLGDARAEIALKILPLSLPFMAISSCIRGYFIARRNVTPSSVAQIIEQIVRIVIIVCLVRTFSDKGLAICCAAVIGGDAISEIFGAFLLFFSFTRDTKKLENLNGRARPDYPIVRKILNISAPITSGRYLNTLLRTAENILVPKNLSKYHLSGKNALSQFGMIKGMALPVLFFPSALLNSVSTLLIPEISQAIIKKQNYLVKSTTRNILKLTLITSFIFTAIFFTNGVEIGNLIYNDNQVGFLLRALSPIIPFMYLDSISDGILKGLDQQLFSFRTAISDSVIRIILILLLVSKTGLNGFILIMYFSNFLTCFLNVNRLLKLTNSKLIILNEIIIPLISAFFSVYICEFLLVFLNLKTPIIHTVILSILSLSVYLFLLFVSGSVKKDDVLNLIH